MKLTAKQWQLIDHLREAGKGKRGRWVRGFPPGTKTVTVNSLLKRGLVEQRFVPMPRSKWPKDPDPLTVAYNYQELRLVR